jgi:hypothetical protein
MPFGTGDDVKSGVVYEWLRGSSRDKIAAIYNISTGGVTNIINEWRNNIGAYIAEDLRELSISLKKANITPVQCSTGFRVAKIMQRLGITEDQFESFMSDVYDRCQKLELGPDQIAKYLMETINLSKIVFPSQIPNYINTKKTEIEELEKQKKNKQEIISNLNKEITKLEENQKDLIENNTVSVDAIKWYKDIREELTNMQISFDDIQVFIQCLRGIKLEGYDVNRVVTKFSEIMNFNKLIDEQKETIYTNINEIEQLKNNKKIVEDRIGFIQLKMSKNQELENIGMGLKELKIIYNTIMEIAKVNDIPPLEALKKFYNDLDEYDDIVGYKNVIEKLKNEISNITTQIANNRLILLSQQQIGTTLQHLFRIGILENDIEDINSILVTGGFDYDSDKPIINKKSLLSDLAKYRGIKLMITSLEQKQTELTNSITELGHQKIELENYLYNMFKVVSSNLKEILLLVKKINIALEYPKILLICLFSDSNNDNNNKDSEDNNAK